MRSLAVVFSVLLVASAGLGAAAGVASAQSESVTLTVSVTTQDGTAVGGATLNTTWDGGSATQTTASNGKAFIDVPAGADVSIAVSHPDYVRNSPVTVEDAEERDVTIEVADRASATITVEDDDGAVDDATVTLAKDGATVVEAQTTDGTVATDTIEAGTYTLTVTKEGYYATEMALDVENETAQTVTIERGTVPLAVNVTDDYFDPPRAVPGATVQIAGVGSVQTFTDGTQSLSVPVNADLNVTVSKEGYDVVERVLSVGESETTLAVDLDRADTLSVEAMSDNVVVGEGVLVTVTDEYGDPVENAQVRLDGTTVARTAADGTATVQIDEAGDRTIVATQNGTTSPEITVTGVATGEETSTAATTTPPGTETTTDAYPVPDIPGQYVPMLIVGIALVAVLFGIRAWQRG